MPTLGLELHRGVDDSKADRLGDWSSSTMLCARKINKDLYIRPACGRCHGRGRTPEPYRGAEEHQEDLVSLRSEVDRKRDEAVLGSVRLHDRLKTRRADTSSALRQLD
jgi:hypothetical protein